MALQQYNTAHDVSDSPAFHSLSYGLSRSSPIPASRFSARLKENPRLSAGVNSDGLDFTQSLSRILGYASVKHSVRGPLYSLLYVFYTPVAPQVTPIKYLRCASSLAFDSRSRTRTIVLGRRNGHRLNRRPGLELVPIPLHLRRHFVDPVPRIFLDLFRLFEPAHLV